MLQIEVAVSSLVGQLYNHKPTPTTYNYHHRMAHRNQMLYEQYISGIHAPQLAQEYNISETRVYEIVKQYRLQLED